MLLTTGHMLLTMGGVGGGGTSMYIVILLTIRGNRTNAGYSTQCVVLLTKNLAALAPAPVQLDSVRTEILFLDVIAIKIHS